jgi:hypothetical protein
LCAACPSPCLPTGSSQPDCLTRLTAGTPLSTPRPVQPQQQQYWLHCHPLLRLQAPVTTFTSLHTSKPKQPSPPVGVGVMWEPPTKQFHSNCQISGDQPSSRSARSTAAPVSTGPCPASVDLTKPACRGCKWKPAYIEESQRALKALKKTLSAQTSAAAEHSKTHIGSAASQLAPRQLMAWHCSILPSSHQAQPSPFLLVFIAAAHSLPNCHFSGPTETFAWLIPHNSSQSYFI